MYLIPSDYEFQVRSEIKAVLKGQSETKLAKAELAAIAQMRSYLQRHYDLALIFPKIPKYAAGKTYQTGDLVYYLSDQAPDEDALVYECLAESTGNLPTDENFFMASDPRSPLIVMYAIDLLLYHLHSGASRNVIPDLRFDRYQEALEWLKGVGAGTIDADLPLKPVEEQQVTSFIRYGSNPKENHRF